MFQNTIFGLLGHLTYSMYFEYKHPSALVFSPHDRTVCVDACGPKRKKAQGVKGCDFKPNQDVSAVKNNAQTFLHSFYICTLPKCSTKTIK